MPQRWRTRTDTGWILHRRAHGEADLWLELYARDLGRIRVLARGARKVPSRRGGHLQLFHEVRVGLAQGHSWWVLTQVETMRWFPQWRERLEAYTAAGYLAELVLRLVPLGERLPGLYPLLSQALEQLAQHPLGPRWVPRVFEWKLVVLAGYRPVWDRCIHCQKPLGLGVPKFLDARAGGLSCSQCRRADLLLVSDRAWTLIDAWLRGALPRVLERVPEPSLLPEVRRLGERYLQAWLEGPLRTHRVIRQLNK